MKIFGLDFRIRIAALVALFLALPAYAADVLPPDIVGIWTTPNSVLRGEALFEGYGLYLDSDGVGTLIGGPPPIGVRIVATYNPDTRAITCRLTERGKSVGTGNFTYDPARKVILDHKGIELYRRFDSVNASTRKALGLEAKAW